MGELEHLQEQEGEVVKQQEPLPPSATLVPLVLFSGGLDSTYLLYQRLMDSDVDVLYVEANQCQNKQAMESTQRRKIIDWLTEYSQEHRLYKVRNQFTMSLNIQNLGRAVVFHQVMPWFHAALNHADPRLHTEVQMAYVMGDEVSGELTNLQKGWEHLTTSLLGGSVPLTFPLRHTRKTSIIRSLPPELLKAVWFCELPKRDGTEGEPAYKACGKCAACITHKQAHERVAIEDAPDPKLEPVIEKEPT